MEQLKAVGALSDSIKKWEKIVAGSGSDSGSSDCALCAVFNNNDRTNACEGCPVKVATGKPNCTGSPYLKWTQHHAIHGYIHPRTILCNECRRLAQAELDFLKSLQKFQRVPLADLVNPQKTGPLMVIKDHWWIVDEHNNVFFYKGNSHSPQCNSNRELVERVMPLPGTRAVFVPWAYVKFDINDYT